MIQGGTMRAARAARRLFITGTLSAAILVIGALPAADAALQDSPIPPIGGGGSPSPQPKPPPRPHERDDVKFLRLHNQERSRRNVHTLATESLLTSFAQHRAAEMANKEAVWHSRNLPAGEHWYVVGENVGRAETVEEVFERFLTSASHRANVFRSGFRAVGIGVAEHAGTKYVAVVYAQPWPARTAGASLIALPAASGVTAGTKPAPLRPPPAETQSVTVLIRLVALEQ
jgi:uncharacterized protein YkwD